MSTIILEDRPRSTKEWQSVELFASAAKTKASNPSDTGDAVYIGDWDKLMIVWDVTATAGDATNDYIDIQIDMSMDGLAWYNVGYFTQWEGDEGAHREQMVFIPGMKYIANPNIIVIGSTDEAETVVLNHLVGRYIRYRLAVTDDGSNGSFTCSLMAMVYRSDIVRQAEDEIKEIELIPLAIYSANESSDVWEIGDSWEWMQVVLRTTNHDTAGADKLDVYIDLSVDGVDWVNVASFTQCDGDDGPWVELATLVPGLLDNVDATVVVTAVCAETVLRPGFVGPFLRGRFVVTDDTTPLFTASLKAYVKPGAFEKYIEVQ